MGIFFNLAKGEAVDLALVREFHIKFDVPQRDAGDIKMLETERILRRNLIEEEASETMQALYEGKPVEVADGLGDLTYVCAGTEVQFGLDRIKVDPAVVVNPMMMMALANFNKAINTEDPLLAAKALMELRIIINGVAAEMRIPLRAVYEEIHRSNMTKVWPDGTVKKREDGKVIKPPTYTPADVASILETVAADG